MRKNIIFSLYKKEMLDILRDKKTILMMIVIPLILYPLIFAGSMFLASSMLNASTSKSYYIGFEGLRDEQAMVDAFDAHKDEHKYSFVYYRNAVGVDNESYLRDGKIDAYLKESVSDNKPYYEIVYLASETDSQTAAGMVEKILQDIKKDTTERELTDLGLEPDDILQPFGYTYANHATNEENAGYLVGMIVPFLLITSILMGALYPAIDATAGEKERGTLETLLTLPVRNLELIIAKFLATSTVAVGAAFLNIVSMVCMGIYMLDSMNTMGAAKGLDLASFIPAAVVTLLCVFTFAMFASAVCLSACIFARSFKEAQNFTTPVMLVFMIGGMAGMIPQVSLNATTALIPVVNIALLITEIFRFHFELSQIAVVLVSNLAYTAVAVVIMGRLFSSENILFGDAAGGLRLLESRSHMKDKQIPGIGDVVLLFAVLLLVVLFGGGLFVMHFGLWGIVLEQALLFGITALYAWYIKTDGKVVFHLHAPRPLGIVSALLCWAGSYIVIQLLGNLVISIFPDLSQANTDAIAGLWEGAPLWLMVLSSALMPAICEEWAFRGFFLGAVEFKLKPAAAIVLTGMFFGAFHMSFLQFILISPLGILLTYIVWKERSIFLSMLMHFLNNLTSVLMEEYKDEVEAAFPFLAQGQMTAGQTVAFAAAGVILLAAGIMLLNIKKKEPAAA